MGKLDFQIVSDGPLEGDSHPRLYLGQGLLYIRAGTTRREGRAFPANPAFCQRAHIRPEHLGRNDSHAWKSENGEEETTGRRLKKAMFFRMWHKSSVVISPEARKLKQIFIMLTQICVPFSNQEKSF